MTIKPNFWKLDVMKLIQLAAIFIAVIFFFGEIRTEIRLHQQMIEQIQVSHEKDKAVILETIREFKSDLNSIRLVLQQQNSLIISALEKNEKR